MIQRNIDVDVDVEVARRKAQEGEMKARAEFRCKTQAPNIGISRPGHKFMIVRDRSLQPTRGAYPFKYLEIQCTYFTS